MLLIRLILVQLFQTFLLQAVKCENVTDALCERIHMVVKTELSVA